ncbi:COR domain-containing protein [Dokdonia sp.]|uniref:leucine-rich repeat domain-containing protein n=1 Tax=Dokdonia sp. TaxID=2024995 RepID=UPI00326752BD
MNKNYQEALNRIAEAKQEKLTKLNLSNLELTECPEEIFELTHLIELNLSHNPLTEIPESIGKLTELTIFELYNNVLTILPDSIGDLINLTELNLSNNQLTEIPESIGKLTHLIELNLRHNELITLPEFIRELTNLKSLSLSFNKLTEVPEFIGKLTNLTELNLSNNQLTEIPKSIGELSNLIKLDLDNNQLTSLPESIGKLIRLTRLYLNSNQLTTIPIFLKKLTNLSILVLGGNRFITIPKFIENLTNLSELYLWGNQFVTIPKFIGKLINLKELALHKNKITSFPESIGQLINLTNLYLDENQLTLLPESIGKLTNLENFDLRNNQLTSLPESIENLTNLSYFDLTNNKFQVGDEVFELSAKEQIQHILNWQRAQKAGTLQPIHEAKVIFIGESNYGKTHLIEFLKNGKIKRKINTTHGIERSQLTVPFKKKDIRLNIWDLGGQEFMRSTHQFFFSERTLYVLVSLARRERNELNHWLKLANQLGNEAPVLVVINKVDKDPHDLDRNSLQRDYPNIIGFVRTSIKNCDEGKAVDTLENLKNKITTIVSDKHIMPGVFEQRPPEWFKVKGALEKLEEEGTDFITYDEYEGLDFIKDLPEEERKSNLKLLSMLGAVVSFVDDPRLINTNVINPQWIMDGVYAIINDPKVKDTNKGKLHIEDLERILPKKKFPKSRHIYLLELMHKFNLCYAAKEQPNVYFIPDLFEDIEPEYTWDSKSSMHFRYDYDDFSPDAFMTRFIVEVHQDIIDENRWRSGVFISNGACSAKVYQSYRKNYIHIEVISDEGEGRGYLYTIRETFRKLHHSFKETTVKQEVLYKKEWLDYQQLVKLEIKHKPWYHVDLDEDLPITDILNGYSTPTDRGGTQKRIKIFLASSYELKDEREQFEIFIHRENQLLYKKGVFIELIVWENFIDKMSQTRLQDEYNNAIKHCDIFVSLFFTKVGKFTLEEFETAFGQFQETGKPFVYTYFKNADIKSEDINEENMQSLFNFKKKLGDLGHFRTVFKNREDLQLQFKRQLEKILPN